VKKDHSAPPPKKAPTLIGSIVATFIAFLFWLLMSLLLSILTEWAGMATLWQEEGHKHAKHTLQQDMRHLNRQLAKNTDGITQYIGKRVQEVNTWVARLSNGANWNGRIGDLLTPDSRANGKHNKNRKAYQEYLGAVPFVVQSFFVRLALVVLSLPIFALCAVVGMVDGLVERDLRRWGGGRESSLTYNLARKSVFPSFVSACVVYISLPVSVHPLWLMGTFAVVVGVFSRVAFERLKKYF
jgi:integrating conjugative element membrane protein (TIGR03747 family)